MRTTLELADDVLAAARALAERDGRTLGQVISDLARRALQPVGAPKIRNGVPLLALRKGTAAASLELINRLRDDDA
jgi:hypothetical protein